jgi:large subunit ribosomal protein L23
VEDFSWVFKSPIITEKTVELKNRENKYTFEVDEQANKLQIAQAAEKLFGVKVIKVNTAIISGKRRRVRMSIGRTSDWKKAIITLQKGEKLDFFEGA